MTTVYTLGHSTHSAEEFIAILKAFAIELVADIRTVPRSRRNPQFEKEALKKFLELHKFEYIHLPALGGLRHAQKNSINTAWENASFRGYADYMQTSEFDHGIDQLLTLAAEKTTTILCAEAVPWRCHRSLVADALLVRGVEVRDILSEKNAKEHRLTPWAHVDGLRITYPKTEQ